MKIQKHLRTLSHLGVLAPLLAITSTLSAQAPSGPNTTDVLVMVTAKPGIDRAQLLKVAPEEVRATVRLYLDGKIRQWFARSDGKGVIFIVPAKDIAEAQEIADSLPMARANLADHEYIPLSPLTPLATLLGPPAAGR